MPRGNSSPKPATKVVAETCEELVAAACTECSNVSARMTTVEREAERRRAGLAAVAMWEKEHGQFTRDEMEEAHRSVQAQLQRTA